MSTSNGGVGNGPLEAPGSRDPEDQTQSPTSLRQTSIDELIVHEDNISDSGLGNLEIQERSVTFHRDSETIYINLVRAEERTDETPITQLDLILAATLVTDAKHSRHGHFRHEERELGLYNLYNHWVLRWTVYFFIALIHCLALFEIPAVPILELPYWATMLIELVCLAAFTARMVHSKMFTSGIRWWNDLKNLIVIGTIALTLLDMILYICLIESGIAMVRWSRILRPLFMINISEGRQIRRAFRNIRRTIPDIVIVLILFFTLIAFFALMALKMFDTRGLKTRFGTPYMSNYWDNYYELYVYVTTANSPDIMMPAYDYNYLFCLFFITYLILCMYVFMSVILAVIYNNYRKNLKTEVQQSVFQRRRTLSQAFDLLKICVNGTFVITKRRFFAVMKIVSTSYSQAVMTILWRVLDEDNDDMISKREFLRMHDLLNVPLLEEKDQKTFLERHFPSMYLSNVSLWVQRVVLHPIFHWVFDGLIVLNAFFIGLGIEEADWFFLTIFSLEIILKLYVLGGREFFRRVWNVFDFVVIFSAVILSIVEFIVIDDVVIIEQTLDVLLVLRVFRLFKPLGNIKQFQMFILTLSNIIPSLLIYGAVIFVFYYMFAILGMEIFSGLFDYYGYPDENVTLPEEHMYCGNEKLRDSQFWEMRYCNNNFNDILRSFVLLFELMVVNQWHILASGYELTTSKWARLYFVCFHITVVIIMMNIFVAFVLEVFILRYSLNVSGKHTTAIEKKISEMGFNLDRSRERKRRHGDENMLVENMEQDIDETEIAPTLRFRLSKSGAKNVEVLLQQLFEHELEDDLEENLGPNIEDLEFMPQQDILPSPLRLDNIT